VVEAQKSLSEDWFLWGLIAVALVVAAGYWALGFLGEEASGSPWVFEGVDPASITAIRSYRGSALQAEVLRKGKGWSARRPRRVMLSGSAVDRWLDNLIEPRVDRRFRQEGTADYGFDSSSRRVELQQGSTTHRLYLGGSPPVGSGLYVRYGEAGEGPLFLLASGEESQIYRTLNDVRRRELFTGQPGAVSLLELEAGGERVRYERSGGEAWTLHAAGGDTRSLDDTATRVLEEGLRSLMFLRAQTFYDTEPERALGTPRAELRVGSGDTPVRVVLGRREGSNRVVRRAGWVPVTVSQDPAGMFEELSGRPAAWPRAARAEGFSVPGSPGG